ncbi:MAG: hypothetical protein V4726_20340 [Verrucomicrobiota bacterium]
MMIRLIPGILLGLHFSAWAQEPAAARTPEVQVSETPPPAKSPEPISSTESIPSIPAAVPRVILVRGADGAPEYAAKFDAGLEAWKKVSVSVGAEVTVVHGPPSAEGGNDAGRLKKILTELPPEGGAEVWLILMGHGTWDGKEARFNLEGPDVSAGQIAEWLKPLHRPLVVINTASGSAPFLNALAGRNRIIITATRSGSEKNYTRFGEYLAASLEDPAADYDQDGQWSLLEWFLTASARTAEFYRTEGRIATEHPLIDDNGDGKGTPAEWFKGLKAAKKSRDNTPLDGDAAHRTWLIPDAGTRLLSVEKRAERDGLETEIAALRERKASLKEDEFYQRLEELMRRLAAVYN